MENNESWLCFVLLSIPLLSPVGFLLRVMMIVWAVWERLRAGLTGAAAEDMALCF